MRYSEKPNAIRFKQNAIFCETQPNSLQGKCSVLRNPTHFSSRTTLMFWETQHNLLKIPFKKLQISEDADISQKNPGAYYEPGFFRLISRSFEISSFLKGFYAWNNEKPNAFLFKEHALFCETQRISLQGKHSISKSPTQFASKKT